MSRNLRLAFATATAVLLVAAQPASAAVRIFSYDSANDVTRRVAGDLTFQFNQRLIFTTVLNIRSTEGRASADLKPADEHALGGGGLSRLVGAGSQERDLYEVKADGEGVELIHAFCPGSSRAWLAFSRMVEAKPLRVQVIGDTPGGGAHLCHTLDFNYRGEWKLPTTTPPIRPGDLKEPRFPY
ncbi:MAG: hypothetical protein WDM85_09800 [Caulobacteraceae bacterium]